MMTSPGIASFVSQQARDMVAPGLAVDEIEEERLRDFTSRNIIESLYASGEVRYHPLLRLENIGQASLPEVNVAFDRANLPILNATKDVTTSVDGDVKLAKTWHLHPGGGDKQYRFMSMDDLAWSYLSQKRYFDAGRNLEMGDLNILMSEIGIGFLDQDQNVISQRWHPLLDMMQFKPKDEPDLFQKLTRNALASLSPIISDDELEKREAIHYRGMERYESEGIITDGPKVDDLSSYETRVTNVVLINKYEREIFGERTPFATRAEVYYGIRGDEGGLVVTAALKPDIIGGINRFYPEGDYSFLEDPDLVETNGVAVIRPGVDLDQTIERFAKASKGREIAGHLVRVADPAMATAPC